jgi:hypothetical protein
MLVTTHALMAFSSGWQTITASKATWMEFLESQGYPDVPVRGEADPQPLSGVLYTALVTEGVIDTTAPIPLIPADDGVVMGRAQRTRLYFAGNNVTLINETLGQNIDESVPASLDEQGNLTIEILAPTRIIAEVLMIVCKGILARATPWFCKDMGYERAQYAGSTLPQRYVDLTKEGNGGFRATVRWLFERTSTFPPILGPAIDPAYLSIYATDVVDPWGNPGRVKTKTE